MYEKHAEVLMIHAIAKQMNEVCYRFEKFETFKEELGNVIKLLIDTQKSVKQELQNSFKQELLNSQNSITKKLLEHKDSIKSELSLIKNEQCELLKKNKLPEEKENPKMSSPKSKHQQKQSIRTKTSPNQKLFKENPVYKGYPPKDADRIPSKNDSLPPHQVTWVGTSISKVLEKEKIAKLHLAAIAI